MHWLAAFPKLLLYWVKRAFRATSALRHWITSAGSKCWNFTFLYASTWRFFRVNFHFLCWNTLKLSSYTYRTLYKRQYIMLCNIQVCTYPSFASTLTTNILFWQLFRTQTQYQRLLSCLKMKWISSHFHIFIQYPNQDCLKWNDPGQFIRLCAAPSGATNSFRHLFPLYVVTLPDKTWCVEPAGFISPLKKRVQG